MVLEKEIEIVLREKREKELKEAVAKTRLQIALYFLLSLLGMIFCLFIPYLIEKAIGLEVIDNPLYYLGGILFILGYFFITNHVLTSFLKKGKPDLKIKVVKKFTKINIEKDEEQFIIDEFFMQTRGSGGNEK